MALLNLGELDGRWRCPARLAERTERAGDLYNAGYARVGLGRIMLRGARRRGSAG